jgi:flavodoxin/NAD-dependent dihydropyrimidine dehydrogenase PreA subunit
MTKVLIATFSQNGSTKKVADQIALGLGSSNFEVTQMSITENKSLDVKEYDIIGIGTPTYFFRPPFTIIDFVTNLPGLENKSTFVFILHGTNQGDCGNWIRRGLNKKGSKDLGYFRSYGADYWIGYIKRGTLFSHSSPTAQELSSAEAFGRTIALRYTDKSPQIENYDPPTPFIYGLERMFVSRPLAKLIYSKTFKADKNCDNCGICIKKCPIGNISENINGKLKWQSKCLLCATCELSCPKDAIHSALDWGIFAPFMIYNINHSKNKTIPFVNVTHKKGKTIMT